MSDTFDKQLEEVLPCNMRCSPGITHSAHCFAARRPAVRALIDALIAGAVEPLIPKIKRAAAMLAMLADRDPIGRKTIDDFADELNETRIALESAPDAARLALEEREKQIEQLTFSVQSLSDSILAQEQREAKLIADMWEPMECGHPKACWVEFEYTETATEYDSAGYPVPVPQRAKVSHCIVCAQAEERDRRVRWDEARKWFNNNDFGWCQRRLNELDPEHAPAHRTGVQGGASRDDS